MGNIKSCCDQQQTRDEDVTLPQELDEHRQVPETVVSPSSQTNFNEICRALELTESEHDEHADTIRRVLKTPGFVVNRLHRWDDMLSRRAVLHVACGGNVLSHVGVQLLLSDERCDVNLPDAYCECTRVNSVLMKHLV